MIQVVRFHLQLACWHNVPKGSCTMGEDNDVQHLLILTCEIPTSGSAMVHIILGNFYSSGPFRGSFDIDIILAFKSGFSSNFLSNGHIGLRIL